MWDLYVDSRHMHYLSLTDFSIVDLEIAETTYSEQLSYNKCIYF